MLYNLVKDTMGEKYMSFAPYIGTAFYIFDSRKFIVAYGVKTDNG